MSDEKGKRLILRCGANDRLTLYGVLESGSPRRGLSAELEYRNTLTVMGLLVDGPDSGNLVRMPQHMYFTAIVVDHI